MEDSTTPKIALLLSRLQALNLEVAKNINSIVRRLDTFDPPLTLQPAKQNIIDRKAEKERHKKRWKVELREIVASTIAVDQELK